MKLITVILFLYIFLISCDTKMDVEKPVGVRNPLEGTWKLISGTIIQGGDTTNTDYTKNKSFIKIINQNHFSFVDHDLNKGKDSLANYTSGAGAYTFKDSTYTEHLEYCSDRAWEGNDFTFTILIRDDTLTQTGIEKIEKLGVNRLNIERYKRLN